MLFGYFYLPEHPQILNKMKIVIASVGKSGYYLKVTG
jgi:hypothetical protein